jgi:hypothetical protein
MDELQESFFEACRRLRQVSTALPKRVAIGHSLNPRNSPAVRALAFNWCYWDTMKLNWRQRELRMAELGFAEFRDMKRTSFYRVVQRAQRLYPHFMTRF